MKPEFPQRLSLPRLHHYADSFPISRATSLFENLACPQGKFRLLRVASEAFHLCVLPYSPALSLTLAQMHSGQHTNGPQSWQHFTITWGDFLKNTVVQTICTSRDLGSGPQGICMINQPVSSQNGEPLFTQASYFLLSKSALPSLRLQARIPYSALSPLLRLALPRNHQGRSLLLLWTFAHCAHHHHSIYIPFVSFMHPKDTVDSTRKMLFYLSVSSLSKLQHLTYSRCLVNNCGLNKSFWTPEWPLFRKPPTFLGCWVSWGRVSEDLRGAVSQQLVFYIFCLQRREIIKELLLTCY